MNPAMCLLVLFLALTMFIKIKPQTDPESNLLKVIASFIGTVAVSPFILLFGFIIVYFFV